MTTHVRPHGLSRRAFLASSGLAALAAGCTHAGDQRPRRPFRVLYGNDTTNTTSCVSPFHPAGEPFRAALLEATVDEAADAGCDVQILQPGHGRVPMWPSRVLPLPEHYAWIKTHYGLEPDTFGRFVLAGGDVVDVFSARCRRRKQAAFVSIRLNDAHNLERVDDTPADRIGGAAAMSLTQFYAEHPEFRIGPDQRDALQRPQNWCIPAVRERRLAVIREVCTEHDIDGLELDFMRFHSLFPQQSTTASQRRDIVTGFVRAVRRILDDSSRRGTHRWLCVRIPCFLRGLDPLGLDPAALHATGVELFNVSASYFTVQQTDFAALRRLAPTAAWYAELCHSVWNGAKITPGYDSFTFRRTTPEQMATTAHLAYARGASGISLFNFQYYREHGGPGRGPFHEPPFQVLKHLGDRTWLARQRQHYFLAQGWNNPFERPAPLPRNLVPEEPSVFRMDLAPPCHGWRTAGRLRLQFAGDARSAPLAVRCNGRMLAATDDVSEPFPNPYPQMLGRPEELRAWTVPPELLADGLNSLDVSTRSSLPALVFIDLAL